MAKAHFLKLKSKYYDASADNSKSFEIRKNDRNFEVGDVLCLQEWDDQFVGREHYKLITYILDDRRYLKRGYVCLGVKPLT